MRNVFAKCWRDASQLRVGGTLCFCVDVCVCVPVQRSKILVRQEQQLRPLNRFAYCWYLTNGTIEELLPFSTEPSRIADDLKQNVYNQEFIRRFIKEAVVFI